MTKEQRKKLEALVWKHKGKDYKGKDALGQKTICYYGGARGTCLAPISVLTDEQLLEQLPTLVRVMFLGPDSHQLHALKTFATANGRDWKDKLSIAWATGRYKDFNGTENYGYLQQVRNIFGPSWLVKFKLPED